MGLQNTSPSLPARRGISFNDTILESLTESFSAYWKWLDSEIIPKSSPMYSSPSVLTSDPPLVRECTRGERTNSYIRGVSWVWEAGHVLEGGVTE